MRTRSSRRNDLPEGGLTKGRFRWGGARSGDGPGRNRLLRRGHCPATRSSDRLGAPRRCPSGPLFLGRQCDAPRLRDHRTDFRDGLRASSVLDRNRRRRGRRDGRPAVLLDHGELRLERRWRGRRRRTRDDHAGDDRRGRPGRGGRFRSNGDMQNDRDRPARDGRCGNLADHRPVAHDVSGNDAPGNEDVLIDHGHVRPVVINDVAARVARAGPVPPPGGEGIPRAEREPSDESAASDRDRGGPAGPAADEGDESRRVVDESGGRRDRHPAPVRGDHRPAAVVVGRPAPRLGGHPRPAPWVLPDPVAGAVRGPVGGDVRRRPDPPVVSHLLPAAVLVEVVRAHDVGVDIPVRAGAEPAVLAVSHPQIPSVRSGERHDVVTGRVDPLDLHRFARVQGDLAPSGRHGRASAPCRNARESVLVHVHAVIARPLKGDGGVGRVDLEDFGFGEAPDLDRSHSGSQRELLGVIGQVERGEVGARAQADEVAAVDLELDASAAAGIDPVAESHRNVAVRGLPVVGVVAAGERHRAGKEGDPRDCLADLPVLVADLGSCAVLVADLARRGRRKKAQQENDPEARCAQRLLHRAPPRLSMLCNSRSVRESNRRTGKRGLSERPGLRKRLRWGTVVIPRVQAALSVRR